MQLTKIKKICKAEGSILIAGDVWQPLTCGSGVLFINWEYLKPVMTKDGELGFFLREAPGHGPMVAVFSGMLCCAIVLPMGRQAASELLDQMEGLMDFSAIDTGGGKGE